MWKLIAIYIMVIYIYIYTTKKCVLSVVVLRVVIPFEEREDQHKVNSSLWLP